MATQYIDAVLRLVDKFTGPMQGAMSTLGRSGRTLTSVGKQVGNVGKSVSDVGMGLTASVTAPVVAFGTAAVTSFGETDKTLRLVQQTMGSTDEEANTLKKTMQDAAASSVFGMQDAADATLNYARAGFSAKEAGDMLAPALDLAAGTATDLSTVTEGLGSALKAFGADSSEAAGYADILAKAQAQANTTVDDLFGAMAAGGSAVKTVGWDVSDLAVATGVLGDAMISGSEAGNALKTGLARLADPAKQGQAALEKYGIELFNEDGTMKSFAETQAILHDKFSDMSDQEQMAAASAIFGKNQMTKWLALIQRSPEDIDKMSGALGDVSGLSSEMAGSLMDGVGGSIEKLKSSFDVLKNDMGGIMGDIVKPVVDRTTEMIDAFRALPDETKKNIVSMVLKFAAVGPALLVFGKMTSGVGKVIGNVGKFGKAISKAGGLIPLLTSPAGIIVGVLAGVAAATVLVIRNWDKIKPVLQKVWGYVSGVFESTGAHFDVVLEKIGGFIESVKSGIPVIIEAISPVVGFVGDVVLGVLGVAFRIIATDLAVVGQLVADIFGGVMDVLSGVIDFISGVFSGDWEKAWNGVSKIFEGIAEGLGGIFKAPINVIIGIVNGVISAINGIGFDVPDWVPVIGGKKFTLDLPTLQMFANGTSYAPGGLAVVGEKGPELVNLPSGSKVYSNAESRRMAGGVVLNIGKIADSMVIREEGDIDKIASAIALKFEDMYGNMVWEG